MGRSLRPQGNETCGLGVFEGAHAEKVASQWFASSLNNWFKAWQVSMPPWPECSMITFDVLLVDFEV